ncbi:glycosyltransferase [Aetokthonos hydrillicola Thurmond2011]|jgi:glycosyltransferase involved in cell wall biosynthesis|uniref:Glycosyltransferase n=1 Tax=Aetokthonos hydrillicola Thurmond2011 TaxID=2712845 RepID=A0AAP5I3L6_9CYAN|nr:glycosyltransferase [Aetokthonos hydrillicola]MBO3463194.1 glycosyltransferase [Aetokthonos hydrillicola CCALA 1050]MBW4589569.1 glycosyltransferase [Aetokthonos hydrillicola CCALA 1050]MDR9893169.1 glycosyltransferase [Aetokthonos hydrillicola Thurmond2011]
MSKKRLLIIQYAGDYREAFLRLSQGGEETYYAQKQSVEAVAKIGQQIEEIAILCCQTTEPYNELLKNGVRAIGTGFNLNQEISIKKLIELIEEQNPTHLVIGTPIRAIIRWAIENKLRTLVSLADSFPTKSLRNKIRNYFLANLLNNKQIDWVGNHGVSASISLANIGVNPDKIIPWDWPHMITPADFSSKTLTVNRDTWNIVYVGAVTESKGVGDAIRAIAQLRAKGLSVKLKVAGKGDIASFIRETRELDIEDCVEFMGLVPNKNIVLVMRNADIVLVPSRHQYPEGFPMTIYEALCSRTPIVASDHPMFINKLKHNTNAMIFPAGNSIALAVCIEKLLSNPEVYHSLSVASYEAWRSLQIPVRSSDLINRWLNDSLENQQWLFEHRLASGHYNLT